VRISVYGVDGRLVRVIADESAGEGVHAVNWDCLDDRGRPLASGIYLFEVEAGQYRSTTKGMLIR
jgi:flagellar hook assembly protein FlgD